MEPTTIIAGAAVAAGLGIGLKAGARLIPMYTAARDDFKKWNKSAAASLYDEMAVVEEERRHLNRPLGRNESRRSWASTNPRFAMLTGHTRSPIGLN